MSNSPRPDTAKARNAGKALAYAANAQAVDREAAAWGLRPYALVEAAGRLCAQQFIKAFPRYGGKECSHNGNSPVVRVLAGSGNNAADALVMLRTLAVMRNIEAQRARVIFTKVPAAQEHTPLSDAFLSIQKLGIPVCAWDSDSTECLNQADIIIDGIAGTGLQGALHGTAREMAEAVNSLKANGAYALVVSIDIPSGNFDGWKPGMPLINADATLAIEPEKLCLYTPAARPSAGRVIPVRGLFPPALIDRCRDAALLDWNASSPLIAPLAPDAYKHRRGVVEIWAGSPGASGAAMLAARGAQAAGAGLVRLIADPSVYPALAPGAGGVMVAESADPERFQPHAVLAGPGWGRGQDRIKLLEKFLPLEAQGIPLILDADAIALSRDIAFNGNALLTPHPAEFAAYTGLPRQDILSDPIPILTDFVIKKNVSILLKGHVLYIASPAQSNSVRIGVIDGMNPALAAGGSGDVLAGFCAAIAGRMYAEGALDLFSCAAAAGSLLQEAGQSEQVKRRFADPLELAYAAAGIAGKAWIREQ